MSLKQLPNAPQVYQKFQEAGGFLRARLTFIEDYLEFELDLTSGGATAPSSPLL